MTACRGDGGATEKQLQALAIYMGHSVEMQRDTYDRRTKAEKVLLSISRTLLVEYWQSVWQ